MPDYDTIAAAVIHDDVPLAGPWADTVVEALESGRVTKHGIVRKDAP